MQSKALVVLALLGVACNESKAPLDPGAAAGSSLRYGAPIELGQGESRTYVVLDQKTCNPVEVGVALTEAALNGLPETGAHGGNGHEHYASHILELPAGHGTPYRFVELDWNPKGHGAPTPPPTSTSISIGSPWPSTMRSIPRAPTTLIRPPPFPPRRSCREATSPATS